MLRGSRMYWHVGSSLTTYACVSGYLYVLARIHRLTVEDSVRGDEGAAGEMTSVEKSSQGNILRCADGQGSRERTGVARVCGDIELATGWPSGREWNGSQAGQGATELGIPRPALGEMQCEVACRVIHPSPEGLGGHVRSASAVQRASDYLDGQPGAVPHVVQPYTYLMAFSRWSVFQHLAVPVS